MRMKDLVCGKKVLCADMVYMKSVRFGDVDVGNRDLEEELFHSFKFYTSRCRGKF